MKRVTYTCDRCERELLCPQKAKFIPAGRVDDYGTTLILPAIGEPDDEEFGIGIAFHERDLCVPCVRSLVEWYRGELVPDGEAEGERHELALQDAANNWSSNDDDARGAL